MRYLPRSRRLTLHLLALGLAVIGYAAQGTQEVAARTPAALVCPVDMRLLVITADGREAVLPAILETLDYLGTPYDIYVASLPETLSGEMLATSGCHGRYQGIMLTTGELGYFNAEGHWASALSPDEWTTLRQYEANFKVRQATWYTYPQPQFGYNIGYAVDTTTSPTPAMFTPAGAAVFSYLNTANPLVIANAYAYLATPVSGATPLLTTADGHALALIHDTGDGREHLSLTFDGNAHLLHSLALGYGIVRWVTRGVFIGERRAYLSPQVDDLFIHNDQWKASTPCGTPFEATGSTIRIRARDLRAVLNWQNAVNQDPIAEEVRLSMAYNGWGATTGAYDNDDLTPYVRRAAVKSAFHWISHTYTHENLDNVDEATARYELENNIRMAANLQLPWFVKTTLVTPDVSGLTNPEFLRIAFRLGVRFVVSDASRPGNSNPTPNTGLVNPVNPGIYMIPRYPNSLFFNVATPRDWVAEYNCIYSGFWNRDLTYQEILAVESDRFLTYLLKGDLNPLMFHQPNLFAYDSTRTRTLLTDLLGATLAKYAAITNLPILSPPMQRIGDLMRRRAAFNSSGVTGTLHPDGSVRLQVVQSAWVPVTGLNSAAAEQYGGQFISTTWVTPQAAVTIAGQ